MNIKTFIFNPFQVNTYLLWNNDGSAFIIDPANSNSEEDEEIKNFCNEKNIKISHIILTHAHIDHILGCKYIKEQYGAKIMYHKDSSLFLQNASSYAQMFGLTISEVPKADLYLADNELIKLGSEELKIIYTPGHADGSICIYSSNYNSLFTGDVLFNQSIGRTDLQTGNFDLLINNINTKLLVLPDETVVYPGHGPTTTILDEKAHNPFL